MANINIVPVHAFIKTDNFEPTEFQTKIPTYINPAVQYFNWLTDEENHQIVVDMQIYTDGSKIEEGTAYAFVAYISNKLIYQNSTKLNLENTVFQSELLAIRDSVLWAETTPNKNISINSDSLFSLQALENISSRDYLINEIVILLQSSEKTYFMNWVKGHTGLEGNEKTDQLAREATSSTSKSARIFFPYPASYIKKILIAKQTEN